MYVKLIIFLVLLGVIDSSSPFDWSKFKRDHNKQYASVAEEAERKQIFLENVDRIRSYKEANPNATFTLGINHLADRRIEELVSHTKTRSEYHPKTKNSFIRSQKLPDSLDWRTKGVISQVKDQGVAGEAYAIVAVEVIETWNAIQTKKLSEGSPARVIDCCPQEVDTFQCIQKLGGICGQGDYPTPTGQCQPNKCIPFGRFDKIMRLKTQNEDTMVTWVQNSTLYVGIDASKVSFQFYKTGIYSDPRCSTISVDHMMQLVGYGKTTTGDPFWICKNSWGVGWGEQGYIRIWRGNNMCGIASNVIQVA